MAFEDDEITEDDLREAGFVEDYDEDDDEDGGESGDDFAMPRPTFDAMGNPVSPPPINPDGNPISSFQQRKLMAKTNEVNPQSQATPSNTPVVQQATPVVAPVEPQKQQTQHVLEKLKSVEATFDVSLSLTLPDMSMLKMLKENSDMSDDDFISFISTKINPKEIAEKIWNLNK